MRETEVAFRSSDGKPKEVILFTIDFKERAGQWLAECLELGTAAYADTLEDARREIRDNVTLQLGSVEELGFIEEYLRQHNVSLLSMETPATSAETHTWAVPALAGV